MIGEDAYFLRKDGLGIADGVGGWTSSRRRMRPKKPSPSPELGQTQGSEGEQDGAMEEVEEEIPADPGMFARLLMGFCEDSLEKWGHSTWNGSSLGSSSKSGMSPTGSSSEGGSSSSHTGGEANGHVEGSANGAVDGKDKGKKKQLDPVEIMQMGYERCMDVVRAEVSPSYIPYSYGHRH